jgi:hypothetical protein
MKGMHMGGLTEDGVIGLDKKFDHDRLNLELMHLTSDARARAAYQSFNQIGLTRTKDASSSNIYHEAIGSLYDKEQKRLIARTEDFTEFSSPMPYINGVIEEMRDFALQHRRRIGRVRIMCQHARTCLSMHRDFDECRFHIPMKTNGNVFFVVADRVLRMPTLGQVYSLSTRELHTIVNADEKNSRVHMLFDTFRAN